MSVALHDTRPLMRTTSRLILLVVTVAGGFIGGLMWSVEISSWAYDRFVSLFADPSLQITSMVMGVAVAYLVGVIHVTTICWLPGALATVSIVQDARSDRDWLKTVAVIALCMVVVTALFGMLISAPASLFAGVAGSRRTVSMIMQPALVASGLVMVVLAMGELGLIRRFLPSLHCAPASVAVPTGESALIRYRRAAMMAIWMSATFGIFCTKPLYLGLLVYVAVIGSVAYGGLALGAYGLGLATTLTLGGLVLLRASRAARFNAWLAEREETFHLVQGIVFAALGAMTVSFFWLRYTIPPS
jgi:cytochrome c biogenesis protein CcdA